MLNLIFRTLLLFSIIGNQVAMAEIETIKKYTLNFSEVQSEVLQGLQSPALGSGMVYKGQDADGAYIFLMLADRGPNIDGQKVKVGKKKVASTIFPVPNFSPFFATVLVKGDRAKVTSTTLIKNDAGLSTSGLPQSEKNSDLAVNRELKKLGVDPNGIDPEGIALASDGSVWICEEYLPSLIRVDSLSGKIIERFSPGNGLPAILAERQENRGFEAITSVPKGRVLIALQSTLDADKQTKNRAKFIRFIKFDPQTKETAVYAYPLTDLTNVKYGAVKIGDLTHIKDNKYLAIETFKDEQDKRHSRIVHLDLTNAEDITQLMPNNLPPEFLESLDDIKTIEKSTLINLAEIGWDKEKTEALTILPDLKTVVLSHDNDFGFSMEKGKISEAHKDTELWFITLKDKLG